MAAQVGSYKPNFTLIKTRVYVYWFLQSVIFDNFWNAMALIELLCSL